MTFNIFGKAHASKIVIKVLHNRIEAKANAIHAISEDQFGFGRGKGTREAIGSLRILAERCMEQGKKLHICFVDYEKAFDRVDWTILMDVLKRLGVDWRDRRLLKSLYMNQRALVRMDGEYSDPCIISRGNRQGCPLSALLFNLYAEELVRKALEGSTDGVLVGGKLIQALRFADDQAMVSDTKIGLQRIMDRLVETAEEYDMKLNTKKTKVMTISRTPNSRLVIMVNKIQLEQVKEFRYLGSVITEDNRCEKEIRIRIAMAKEAFNKKKELLKNSLSVDLKKRMVKVFIWSVLLYGAETWCITEQDIWRIEAMECGYDDIC